MRLVGPLIYPDQRKNEPAVLRDELRFQPVRQLGDGIMSTPDDYRAMAEECFRWARQA